jgi:hypothetical protein
MKLWIKITLGVVIVIALLGGLLFYGFYKFTTGMCGNRIVSEIPSPDKDSKAVVFVRDCGATTGFSTQISILPLSRSLPNRGGNTFAADDNHGGAVGPLVKVQWESAHKLIIMHQIMARVFKAEKKVDGVVVEYSYLIPEIVMGSGAGIQNEKRKTIELKADFDKEREAQKDAEDGHQPWRFDPISVAHAAVVGYDKTVKFEDCTIKYKTNIEADVICKGIKNYDVKVKRLIRQDGIWTAISIRSDR